MVTFKELRDMALSLSETTEEPHFEKTSFRIRGMIFATYEKKTDTACVKLTLDDQYVFSSAGDKVIYPVPNSWGRKGWTFVELKKIDKEKVFEIIKASYSEVVRHKKMKPATKTVLKKTNQKSGLRAKTKKK